MAPDERRELGDELSIASSVEIGLDPVLDCREPQFLERRGFAGGEGDVEPGERLTVPERVGVA